MIRFYYFFSYRTLLYYIVYKMTNHLARHSNSCAIALFLKIKKLIHTNLYYTSYVSSIAAKEEAKALAHDQSGGVHCTLDFSLPLSHHYTYYILPGLFWPSRLSPRLSLSRSLGNQGLCFHSYTTTHWTSQFRMRASLKNNVLFSSKFITIFRK